MRVHWPYTISLVLCAAALMLALPLSLGSLPAFSLGYWEKAESLQIWLHLSAALGCLGLIGGLLSGDQDTRAAASHPLVLITGALGAWALLCAPLVELPWLSVTGTVQSGYGALWFLDLAILTACAIRTRTSTPAWTALCWWAAGTTMVIAGLKFYDGWRGPGHLLVYVAAYYGWIGIALAATIEVKGTGRTRWLLPAASAIAAVAVVAASRSATAVILLAGGAAFVAIAWFGRRNARVAWLTNSNAAAATLIGLAAVLPYCLLRWVPALGAMESLRDRQLLQRMMHAALSEQSPVAWLVGNGWGRTQDAFHAHLAVTGENLWRPTWIFLESDYFHSHNWLLETLYAAGIPGVVLALAGFLAIARFAAPGRRGVAIALAVALAAFSALWFQLAVSVPFIALALASVQSPAKPRLVAIRPAALIVATLAALQVGWAALHFDFARDVTAFRAGRLAAFPEDPRGSDLTASEVIRDDLHAFSLLKAANPEARSRVLAMFDYLSRHAPNSVSSHFIVTAANSYTRIYGSGDLSWLAADLAEGKAMWGKAADRLLVIAPGRSDALIPYLSYHAVTGALGETARITEKLLSTSAREPVGLYFAGLLLVLEPSADAKRQGIEKLRASKAAGIERFMPLDKVVLELIARP